MKCNDPERGAVYTALLAQHTGLTDEQMREFVSSDPAVPGPHDANVSRIVRKGKLFRADWFAHCNPVDGDEQFRLAQFDALNSFGARRSEIWLDLEDHPW